MTWCLKPAARISPPALRKALTRMWYWLKEGRVALSLLGCSNPIMSRICSGELLERYISSPQLLQMGRSFYQQRVGLVRLRWGRADTSPWCSTTPSSPFLIFVPVRSWPSLICRPVVTFGFDSREGLESGVVFCLLRGSLELPFFAGVCFLGFPGFFSGLTTSIGSSRLPTTSIDSSRGRLLALFCSGYLPTTSMGSSRGRLLALPPTTSMGTSRPLLLPLPPTTSMGSSFCLALSYWLGLSPTFSTDLSLGLVKEGGRMGSQGASDGMKMGSESFERLSVGRCSLPLSSISTLFALFWLFCSPWLRKLLLLSLSSAEPSFSLFHCSSRSSLLLLICSCLSLSSILFIASLLSCSSLSFCAFLLRSCSLFISLCISLQESSSSNLESIESEGSGLNLKGLQLLGLGDLEGFESLLQDGDGARSGEGLGEGAGLQRGAVGQLTPSRSSTRYFSEERGWQYFDFD